MNGQPPSKEIVDYSNWSAPSLRDEIERLQTQKTNLFRTVQSKQSKIDALMLEFCPGEMSAEQRTEYAKAQQPTHEPQPTAPDWQQIARERTADVARADAQIERLQRDIETGFMPGTYARLKNLQEAERERDELRARLAHEPSALRPGLERRLANADGEWCIEPAGYLHEITEPECDTNRMYSAHPSNPWSHWVEKRRERCTYKCTPLYAAPPASTPPPPVALSTEYKIGDRVNHCGHITEVVGVSVKYMLCGGAIVLGCDLQPALTKRSEQP